MRLLFFLLLLSSVPLYAQKPGITIVFEHAPIEEVLHELEKRSGYTFSYESTLIYSFPAVNLSARDLTITEILEQLFRKRNISYLFSDKIIILKKSKRMPVISGTVIDAQSKETLINATVYDLSLQIGTTTNAHGGYSLSFPVPDVNLTVSFVGYQPWHSSFQLQGDTTMVIALEPQPNLKEVIVKGQALSQWIKNVQPGQTNFPIFTVKKLPNLLSESDLIKTIQLLPGVKTGTEGMAGLFVRGGNMDENLYLMDGVPIYNPSHLLGFFSTFNSDAVKNVEFYRGSFPARFGGRLSSIVDVRLKDGDMQEYHGNISIGLISSKFNLEGPIFRNKTSFNISGRRTYTDLIASPLIKKIASNEYNKTRAGYYFADANAKITHKFSDDNQISVYAYWGNDKLRYKEHEKNFYYYSDYNPDTGENEEKRSELLGIYNQDLSWAWGNFITAAEWNYNITNRLNCNTSLSYNRYMSKIRSKIYSEDIDPLLTMFSLDRRHFNSGIQDWAAKSDFTFSVNPWNKIRFGGNYTYHTFIPETSHTLLKNNSNQEENSTGAEDINSKIKGPEMAVYAENEMALGKRVRINPGLYFSAFRVKGKNYFSVQPRISIQYTPAEHLSLKASYTEMNQYIHLLSSGSFNLPTDLWVPVTNQIRPMYSRQVAGGIYYRFKQQWDFSLEGYYKTMNHQIDYVEGASIMPDYRHWDEKVAMGKGLAYGMEVQLQKSNGKTTGWINYTLAWAKRRFPQGEVNYGEWYPAKYDNRNGVNIVVMHKFNKRFDISAIWVFNSGSRTTLALERYNSVSTLPGGDQSIHKQQIEHYDYRNNYRMENYHRLDLGFNFHKQKRRGIRTWSINLYNSYCRLNPFYLYADEESVNGKKRAILGKSTLFPIIPSFSYTFTF